jgi:ribosomal protein S12 methylthiotransferase accessory factor
VILDPSAPAERRLVDPRLGLITAVVRHQPLAGIPPAWVGYWTHVARTDVYAPWLADEYGFGAAIGDLERARRAAVGEAVERYCGNIVPSTLTIDSFDGLSSAGRKAIDPRDVALYSREQYATPGFPFTPLACDLDVAWVAGTDLHTGEETLAPASLVYLDYFRGDRSSEPVTNSLMYAGMAAGATREQAERSALEELLERDARTIWWASGAPAAAITDGHMVADLLNDPEADRRPIRFLHVPSAFGVAVVAVLIDDPARGLVAAATSSPRISPSPRIASSSIGTSPRWTRRTSRCSLPASAPNRAFHSSSSTATFARSGRSVGTCWAPSASPHRPPWSGPR